MPPCGRASGFIAGGATGAMTSTAKSISHGTGRNTLMIPSTAPRALERAKERAARLAALPEAPTAAEDRQARRANRTRNVSATLWLWLRSRLLLNSALHDYAIGRRGQISK